MRPMFEYQWPCDKGEIYVPVQEASRFLGVADFGSKYPDALEDSMEKDEEMFILKQKFPLRERRAVHLTKLLEIMEETFPDKYEAYMSALHDQALDQAGLRDDTKVERIFERPTEGKRLARRAIKQVNDYNHQLLQERLQCRTLYYDTQTQLVHVPLPKRICHRQPSLGDYPVALIPGQYQDFVPRYTPEQLSCFPLNTMTCLPPSPPSPPAPAGLSHAIVVGACSSQNSTVSTPVSSGATRGRPRLVTPRLGQVETREARRIKHDAVCGLCLNGPARNRKGQREELIHCSSCENSGHPSCLEMTTELVHVIKTYNWQCMECKVCTLCSDPGDEDKMMFCDECDRGYHTFCVGLKDIPSGNWVCQQCSVCSSCKKVSPGPSAGDRWRHEVTCPRDGSDPKFIFRLCTPCSKLFRSGNFCPVCLNVYHNDETDMPMVCCDSCDRWIHTGCDNISDDQYKLLSDDQCTYRCVLCRGEKPDRVDTFHKQYRNRAHLRI